MYVFGVHKSRGRTVVSSRLGAWANHGEKLFLRLWACVGVDEGEGVMWTYLVYGFVCLCREEDESVESVEWDFWLETPRVK